MKSDTMKLSRPRGSSFGGETVPLFPPLHVNEAGKTDVRAPPRNKMALYEQFTVPYNRCMSSNEVAVAPKQHGTSECHYAYVSYTVPATLASAADNFNREVHTNAKSSSSIGSLSVCSAVVNVDEAQRVHTQERAEDTSPSFASKFGTKPEREWSSDKTLSKDKANYVNEACGIGLPRHNIHQRLESFHKFDDGSAGGTFKTESLNVKEGWNEEATSNCEGLASVGSQPQIGEMELKGNTDTLKYEGFNQLKSNDQYADCQPSLENIAEPLQKPGVVSQGDAPLIDNVADAKTPIDGASPCEKMTSPMVLLASIKPKNVMHAVGQKLFWKARKAILRQQEVFSNQVFELHKLIRVQKLLAKMPTTLMNEHTHFGAASDKVGCGYPPHKGHSHDQGDLADRREGTVVPFKKSGGRTRGSKRLRRFVPLEESEGVGAGVRTKKPFHNSMWHQDLTTASLCQPRQSLSSDGMSAWGYPMAPINRPLICPLGAASFPFGSAYGGVYVVGSNPPPRTPFTFPCYGQKPEQTTAVCPNNQWPSTTYHTPFLGPVVNDWFAMNHHAQVSLASGSEKAGPTNSAPSINMKAEASTHSAQPAVVPCAQQQLGTGHSTRLRATKSFGSYATASAAIPPNSLPRKPGSGYVGGQAKGVKERGQLATSSGRNRQYGMDVDYSIGENALNLFPLQPSTRTGGHSEGSVPRPDEDSQGRVIKAVPRSALAASESAAGILLSIQRERQL
eukprot:c19117_g1_i1 orf=603-2804(+)